MLFCKKSSEEALLVNGMQPDTVYFSISGTVGIYKVMTDGIQYQIAADCAPSVFGETEAFTGGQTLRGTVTCTTDSSFVCMPMDVFRRWMKTANNALYEITVLIIEKNIRQHSKDRALLFSSGVKRLGYLLLEYFGQYEENQIMSVSPKRDALAEQTGLNVRTISRCINKLSDLNYIQHTGKTITMTKQQALDMYNYLNSEN